jgi:hypothetical protein
MNSTAFDRLGGICAILGGAIGFLYSVAFIVIARSNPDLGAFLSALFLMLGGLFSSVAIVALYVRVRAVDPGLPMLALLFGLAAALSTALHGSYDLANVINPPDVNVPNLTNLPSQVDPRGFMTFGVAGLSVIVFAVLMGRAAGWPKGLSGLGFVLGALLIVVYLGRLIVLTPTSLVIVIPAALTGFVVNPIWYIWLGVTLRHEPLAAQQLQQARG